MNFRISNNITFLPRIFSFVLILFFCHETVGALNVHIVCHSHDDVGWVHTMDEYYEGNNTEFQCVKCTLDSVIKSLLENPERKFIEVEVSYFSRWYNSKDSSVQDIVQRLVKSGSLEFIGGGWSMNDEATTHYQAIIDQMALGHRFLNETFGVVPKVAWQIDPFGHSSTVASLFQQMGFDGYVLNRIDYQDKAYREKNKEMQFYWRPSQSSSDVIFTHVTYNHYSPPPGFCFEPTACGDPVITPENVQEKSQQLLEFVKQEASVYRTGNVMLTMGNDFVYVHSEDWFDSIDQLIHYINSHQEMYPGGINLMYSTPSIFLQQVRNDATEEWSTKTDDFMPYADNSQSYWTGYYTSRPSLKGFVRESSNILQACKQLGALDPNPRNYNDSAVRTMEEAMGVLQHHDAVSGTEKQYVTYDYESILNKGISQCQDKMLQAFTSLAEGTLALNTSFCPLINDTICNATILPEIEGVRIITLYNPSAHAVETPVRVPVSSKTVLIFTAARQEIVSQVAPGDNPYPTGFKFGAQPFYVEFVASLPPLGFSSYFMSIKEDGCSEDTDSLGACAHSEDPTSLTSLKSTENEREREKYESGNIVMQNKFLRAEFNSSNGILQSVLNKKDGTLVKVNISFEYYPAHIGPGQQSGAYIFRPDFNFSSPVGNGPVDVNISIGPVVQTLYQKWSSYITTITRLYSNASYLEIEHTVGPIPLDSGKGNEIIMRFYSDLDNNRTFYTDSNGREMMKRVFNYRESWPLQQVPDTTPQNYYPINTAAYLEDVNSHARLTVLTDRSQGGASLKNGQLEFMLHRRLQSDDGRGVDEALNEPGITGDGLITRGKHRIFVGSPETASVLQRTLEEQLFNKPIMTIGSLESSVEDYVNTHRLSYSAGNLPPNVHLTTLQKLSSNQFLLRLSHMYGATESSEYSVPVNINLQRSFPGIWFTNKVEELSLDASKVIATGSFPTTLNPMQTRTFRLSQE
eukprot:940645_1